MQMSQMHYVGWDEKRDETDEGEFVRLWGRGNVYAAEAFALYQTLS